MRPALFRAAVGLYVLWLSAVVLLVLGRSLPVPTYDVVRSTVVVGGVVLTVVGTGRILGDRYRRLSGGDGDESR